MLSVVKMPLKGEVVGRTINGHGNYIVDHGKSWKNHGILFLNSCGNPVTVMVYWLLSSTDNLCKQFGSRSGPTECWS